MEAKIKKLIEKMKRLELDPPFCIVSAKEIDISKHPEITEIQIEPDMSKDEIILYPCT